MFRRNIPIIILLNVLGIALFLSYYLPVNHGFWAPIDSSVFFYFNNKLATNETFLHFVAITNNRAFDVCSLLAMCLLYFSYYVKESSEGRRRMLIIGIVMLLSAVVLNQLGHQLPVAHKSPSLSFPHVNRVSELTGIPTKDSSGDSFPGDHGMMLMVFTVFMLRYLGTRAFACAVVITVLFSMPRLMIGAHWFTDIMVGSLSVVLVGGSWWLMTPASDMLVKWLDKKLPKKSIK